MGIESSSGLIEATGVLFNGGGIRFNYQSSGTLTSNSFTNVQTIFNDYSNPTITNNTFDLSSTLYFYTEDALPRLSGNTYNNMKFYISFYITKDLTLKKIAGSDYYLSGDVNVKNGAKLTIESGVKIYLQNYILRMGIESSSGLIEATGVLFNGGGIRFNYQSSGTLTSNSFTNVQITINDGAQYFCYQSNYNMFSELQNNSSNEAKVQNNYWGDPTGPKHSTNPNGYGTTISDKVDYIPFATKAFDITTSIERISETLPTTYSLAQNYPNPFNPSTKINYSVPQESFVKLIVYDILGKEITTLVNEDKAVGNYQVEFNGSNLSSGVYFYRMESGNFSDMKKFIFVR